MCTVAAMAPAILSGGASVASFVGQSRDASAQSRFQNQRYQQTINAALSNFRLQSAAMQRRMIQEAEAFSAQSMDRQAATRQAKGQAVVSANEGGVAGNSINVLISDFDRIDSLNAERMATQFEWSRQQNVDYMQSLQANAQSNINAALPQPVSRPSLLGLGLNLAGAAFSAYDTSNQQLGRGPYGTTPANDRMSRLLYGNVFDSFKI